MGVSVEHYYNQCIQHVGRVVEITCRDGRLHRGVIHSVDRETVYLRTVDNFNGPRNNGPGLFIFGAAFAGGFAGALTGVALGSIFAFRPFYGPGFY